MSSNIEKLQLEMPLVFEFRDDLVRIVAEATADYHLKIDRLRVSLEWEEFEAERERAYRLHAASLAPIRAELDRLTKQIANILAAMPPEPIFVPL